MAKNLEGVKLNDGDGKIYFNGLTLPLSDFTHTKDNGRQTDNLLYAQMNNYNNAETKDWNASLVLVEEQMREILNFADQTAKGADFQIVWTHKLKNDTIRYTYNGCLLNNEGVNLQASSGGTVPISGTFKSKKIS